MGDVGIFGAIALIPFVIKIFLGMLSDRVDLLGMGHRKPYILLGLAIQTLCLALAPFIDPATSYWGFVALAFILQLGIEQRDLPHRTEKMLHTLHLFLDQGEEAIAIFSGFTPRNHLCG